VDLPSTGYGLAMFQSAENFTKLFQGGPLNRDAEAMLKTFKDPKSVGHVIVALPEEMPLRESLELNDYLKQIFPTNPAAFIANRLFPPIQAPDLAETSSPDDWPTPLASSMEDYAAKRSWLENYNLRLWRDEKIDFARLDFVPPIQADGFSGIVKNLAYQFKEKAYL
jgi:hypothetical protein